MTVRDPMKTLALMAALAITRPLPGAEAGARLWVVQPPAALVVFDLSDFSRLDNLAIPQPVLEHPERLTLGAGLALAPLDDQRIWVWDGTRSRTLNALTDGRHPDPPGIESVAFPQWLLTADRGLLVAANDFATARGEDQESVPVVTTRFHVDRLDLAGGPRGRVLEHVFGPCSCRTGACDETCPQGELWAPGGVMKDFFFVTYWVPGQLSSEYGPSFLYRRASGAWRPTRLSHGVELFLDAADTGSTWVEAEGDGGCCGWANEGSDRALWVRRGQSQVLFDEWARYHNQNYDVSFFTASARIAPGGRRVAYTVSATERAGVELRLSSDGHADTLALAAIQKALAEVPLVEVQEPARGSEPVLRLPGAELVGWASAAEIVIVERGRVVAVDVATGRRRESPVRVRSAADVFVVGP